MTRSIGCKAFHQRVKILQAGILDNHFATAAVVLNCDLEAERALQALLGIANIRINGRGRLGAFLALRLGSMSPCTRLSVWRTESE